MLTGAIENLMDEHRLIEKVLDSLAAFTDQLESGTQDARGRIARYALFFREFADRRHHGKEEDRLFVRMADYGFSPDWGPLKVMLQDHEVGRARVRELAAIGQGTGPLSGTELQQARKSAGELDVLLRGHIQKEDQVLYPAAVRALPGEVMESLAIAFETFERETMGEGGVAHLRQVAVELVGSDGTPSQDTE